MWCSFCISYNMYELQYSSSLQSNILKSNKLLVILSSSIFLWIGRSVQFSSVVVGAQIMKMFFVCLFSRKGILKANWKWDKKLLLFTQIAQAQIFYTNTCKWHKQRVSLSHSLTHLSDTRRHLRVLKLLTKPNNFNNILPSCPYTCRQATQHSVCLLYSTNWKWAAEFQYNKK
jgi:hypothetical protein